MPASFASPISCSSPVIDTVMARKKQLNVAKDKLYWGIANFISAIFCFLEAQTFHLLVSADSSWRPIVSHVETFICLVLTTNALIDWYSHLFPFGISAEAIPELPLNPLQLSLLGVKKNEYGFKAATPVKNKGKGEHPFGFSSPLNGSFLSPQSSAVYSGNASSLQLSALDSSSWVYHANGADKTSSPAVKDKLRDSKLTPSLNGTFTDEKSLKDYLKVYEKGEKGLNQSNNSGIWNNGVANNDAISNSGRMDNSAILRNLAYQVSTPMPCTDSPGNIESPDGSRRPASSSDPKSETLCRKLGIDPLDLVFWMQNIRIWISQTILCRVVSEIESVNKKLVACGLSDCLIGYVGVERLRKCVTLPQFRDHLTELNNLLSFLSITTHQEYLVQRLKELSQGGALSEFKWNGGGRFKGNEWTDKLPTDSELIMGFFAAYMDSRLPANFRNTALSGGNQHLGSEASSMSHYIEDKPFTGVFYITLPETSPQERRRGDSNIHQNLAHKAHSQQTSLSSSTRSIVILQSSERPPHFFLQLDGKERVEISAGRNNLFHTLLFFLYHIKSKESGQLGRINLGISGVNMLWVINNPN